jgi:hypothetical protein
MEMRCRSVAIAALALIGFGVTAFAQAQSRSTLEGLLEPPATAIAKPPEPSGNVEKSPAPDKAAVDEATELVRQAYEEDLKAIKEKPEQVVTKLIAAATSTADPAQKYAILLVAEKAAVEASNSGLALRAFDTRATAFAFDDAQERLILLETLQKRSAPVDEGLFRYVVEVAQQALDADQYEQAEKATGLASAAAKAIEKAEKMLAAEAKRKRQQPPEPIAPSLVDEATALQKTVREQKALAADYVVAKEKLAANPDDAEAAGVVGRHLCFVKGNWKEGLASLAKGKSESLKSLAARELAILGEADPAPKSLFALAGDWWKTAEAKDEAMPDSHAAAIKEHAAGIYARLKGKSASPLEAAIVEKRSSTQATLGRDGDRNPSPRRRNSKAINLFGYIDPARDAVSGHWEISSEGLQCDAAAPAKIRIPFDAPDQYDFVIEFTPRVGGDCHQFCVTKDREFTWSMASWAENKYFGFGAVDGEDFFRNKTTVEKRGVIVPGRRYVSAVCVRTDGVFAVLNGEQVTSLKTDYTNVSHSKAMPPVGHCLGLATWKSPILFHRIELIPVMK